MSHDPIQVLCCGTATPDLTTSGWGPFVVQACSDLPAAADAMRQSTFDALIVHCSSIKCAEDLLKWPALALAVLDAALVVVMPEPPVALALRLQQHGAQDVLPLREALGETVARMLRLAVERKRIEVAARKAYAIDLATGLPSHAQLLEHMTHLLALREREPAPMALIVLRIIGLTIAEATLGAESANVLRRKVAVRVRSGLRASDVVASLGNDSFAVLLAWIDAAADGPRVAGKIAQSLAQPLLVAGAECSVAVSAGVALYPDHGRDADALLRRAAGQAAEVAHIGRADFASSVERGPGAAANDEGPPTFT